MPRHVERELRNYLACGVLAHGFVRVRCVDCGFDRLVDLSPHVVGRLVEEPGPAPVSIHLERHDGWKSAETQLNEEGAFVLAVDVLPRRPNEFTLAFHQ